MGNPDDINVEINDGGFRNPDDGIASKCTAAVNPANHTLLENVLAGLVFVFFILVIILAALAGARVPPTTDSVCTSRMCLWASSFREASMNMSIDPCQDFYRYSCANYPRYQPIAPDEGEKRVIDAIATSNTDKLENILQSAVKDTTLDSYERKVKKVFQSCNNDYLAEILKGETLNLFLADKWWVFNTSAAEGYDFNSFLQFVHVDLWQPAFFDFVVRENYLERNKNAIEIHLGGLGMSYVYYYNTRYENVRSAYKTFIRTVAGLLTRDSGIAESTTRVGQFVDDVYKIEAEIANITRDSEIPDPEVPPHLPENQVSLEYMNQNFAPFNFLSFFQYTFGRDLVTRDTKIVLYEADYVRLIVEMIGRIQRDNPTTWKRMLNNYLAWRMIQPHAQDLSFEYVHAQRVFYEARTGRTEFSGKLAYCFYLTKKLMNKAVGALFVADHFADAGKAKIDKMFTNLRTVAKDMINENTWFDAETKAKAHEKLDAVVEKAGYPPDEIETAYLNEEYKLFNVSDGDGAHLLYIINYYYYRRMQLRSDLSKPVDKTHWYGSLYDVAVYMYNPWVELLVPAGALQFPLFQDTFPDYLNYGSIGSMIAQEIVKSIDETGQYYDKEGSTNEWWSDETKLAYLEKGICTVEYYAPMRAGPYKFNNREFYAELKNIISRRQRDVHATMAGLEMAYRAYNRFVGTEPRLVVSKHNAQQSVFIAFAQRMCYSRTDYFSFIRHVARREMPEEFLVNGVVANSPAFRDAFNCPANTPMNYEPKCKVY